MFEVLPNLRIPVLLPALTELPILTLVVPLSDTTFDQHGKEVHFDNMFEIKKFLFQFTMYGFVTLLLMSSVLAALETRSANDSPITEKQEASAGQEAIVAEQVQTDTDRQAEKEHDEDPKAKVEQEDHEENFTENNSNIAVEKRKFYSGQASEKLYQKLRKLSKSLTYDDDDDYDNDDFI